MSVEATVIVPTLNDEPTLAAAMERLNRVIAASGAATEVVVVDAGSDDGTVALAGELADRFPLLHTRILVQDQGARGFGSTIRLGMAYAQGRFCVIVQPDARDPLDVLPRMLAQLRSGVHLVLCSRFEAAADEREVPARFRLYQRIYRRAIRVGLGYDIPDSTYGFRAFHRPFVQALGLQAHSFAVCPEMTFKVLLAGGKVERVPGAQAAPMLRSLAKFRLKNELFGYGLILGRAALHRAGVRWF